MLIGNEIKYSIRFKICMPNVKLCLKVFLSFLQKLWIQVTIRILDLHLYMVISARLKCHR